MLVRVRLSVSGSDSGDDISGRALEFDSDEVDTVAGDDSDAADSDDDAVVQV